MIAPSLWLFLAAAGAVLLTWFGRQRPAGVNRRRWAAIIALQGLGTALLLVILLNPEWHEAITPPGGKPLLTVLVDSSASMATTDAGATTSRFDQARRLAERFVGALTDRFETRIMTFAAGPRLADVASLARSRPDGPATDLAAAIAGGLEEPRPQGQVLMLLSDGIHNAGGQAERVLEAVRLARGLDAPISTRTIGGAAEVRDLALDVPRPQELAFVAREVSFEVRLRRRGLGIPQAVVVLSSEGRELERKTVAFERVDRATVRLEARQDQPGLYLYEARVEPFPGEITTGNNVAALLLRVVDKPLRVLLLEGKPYWDAKFLTRALASDRAVALDSLVRLAEGRFLHRSLSSPDPRSPEPATGVRRVDDWKILDAPAQLLTGPDGLKRYQVIVLGRASEVFLSDEMMARLRGWIAHDGGALVCYRGAPVAQVGQPLAQLLPVRWTRQRESRFQVQLTEQGRDLRWLPEGSGRSQDEVLAQLPTLARDQQALEPRPLAVVLATSPAAVGESGGSSPVVSYQPYGSGRVVVIEGAGMWRWAFLPPAARGDEQDAIYASFWQSLLRWLNSAAVLPPGTDRALRADKISFRTGEVATATLALREEVSHPAVPTIELTGGRLTEPLAVAAVALGDEPGIYRVRFGMLPEGHYRARIATGEASPADQAMFDVRGFDEEQLDLAARPDLMARIARESGGAVLAGDTPEVLAEQFRNHLARNRTEQTRRYPAWDRWWAYAAIVLIWAVVWQLRRSSGLV